jgi:ketosteroid isomerase-like protein
MSPASLDRQEAEQFCRRFEALFNVGDAAGMTACYAEDARLLAENTELIIGRPAIEQFWRAAIGLARVAGAVRTIGLDDVITSGSLGYTLGTVTVRIQDGPTLVTKYAVIWQRDPDGHWRIAVDSSSPNPREG